MSRGAQYDARAAQLCAAHRKTRAHALCVRRALTRLRSLIGPRKHIICPHATRTRTTAGGPSTQHLIQAHAMSLAHTIHTRRTRERTHGHRTPRDGSTLYMHACCSEIITIGTQIRTAARDACCFSRAASTAAWAVI